MTRGVRLLTLALTIHLAVSFLAAQEPAEKTPPSATEDLRGDSGDGFTTWGAAGRTVRYDYRLINRSDKPATEIDVYVPLPRKSPRQIIHYVKLPQRPEQQRIFTDRHGQRLVHYRLDRLDPGTYVDLGYVVGVTLKNLRWNPAESTPRKDAPTLTAEERQRYLRAETNYSMDSPMMRSVSASLVEGATSDYEKLVRIHDHVASSIRYVRDDVWDPAETVLTRGTGSCSEYNYVLSGLCRLAGLPTRCVGGSSNGLHDLPVTDTVYHRWTEVFLDGFGWFPADCSRDGNPIRGKRSHFGRNYVDVLVWCQQAGGEEDTLGWDYRAKAHIRGEKSRVRESHRTRWYEFQPEDKVEAARAWFLDGAGEQPGPDLLECALVDWHEASLKNQTRMLRALAAAGRNACLRRAGTLPEADGLRDRTAHQFCASPKLAETILKESQNLAEFRDWYRDNESRLVPTGDGKFQLAAKGAKQKTGTTTDSASEIWASLVPDVVGRFKDSLASEEKPAIVVMPVTDQTLAGLGAESSSIHQALKAQIAKTLTDKVVDDVQFDRWMKTDGPGTGEYWILANGEVGNVPAEVAADIVVVPVCITSRSKDSVLYHLELKTLDLRHSKYTKAVARVYRKAADEEVSGSATLVGGGDTVLARWEHDMVSRQSYVWPLEGVRNAVASADAALCNLECCVSRKGTPAEKGEHCPFFYRARPEMLQCLTSAGIDVVTGANNHGGDYGPASVADTADWCDKAGLVCVGIGNNMVEAETPRVVQVGPLRVAFAGMDNTKACYAAGEDQPGASYVSEEGDLADLAAKVDRIARWADGRCDLLVLTIHWGQNWVRETQPVHRKMARIAFEHGVDAILGHSAHRLQGIEVVDGKPVVYDMGNLLFDCKLKPEGRQSALFRLHLSNSGVHKIEVLPVEALNGHTARARCEEAAEVLSEMDKLCSALGTNLAIEEDLEGRPMGVVRIAKPKRTPRKAVDTTQACVALPAKGEKIPPALDTTFLNREIPADAKKLLPPVEVASGAELVACRVPAQAEEGGILPLATWWRVTGPVARNVMPAFHFSPKGETPRRGTPWYTRHDGADWTVPLSLVEPGTGIEDIYPARLAGLPAGPCEVFAVLIDTSRPEGGRVLGETNLGPVEIVPRTQRD